MNVCFWLSNQKENRSSNVWIIPDVWLICELVVKFFQVYSHLRGIILWLWAADKDFLNFVQFPFCRPLKYTYFYNWLNCCAHFSHCINMEEEKYILKIPSQNCSRKTSSDTEQDSVFSDQDSTASSSGFKSSNTGSDIGKNLRVRPKAEWSFWI